MPVKFEQIMLELKTGNIADQPDCDAIVNAANAELRTGGGVAGAIHKVGDPQLTELTRSLAPISPGEAVITEAPNMPNKFIIHCLGPVYGKDKPEDKLLADCYRNALDLAEENKIESIVFPAISTGAFGFPKREAANIAFKTVKEKSSGLKHVNYIRFVLFDAADYNLHWDTLKEW
ncbi:MAG: macro domain-containing protein [Balneolaceae bacterium]|nr:macro domain-containing protein [Balneolaceae bacterium]